MATWNELFINEKFIATLPQPEVYKFIKVLEGSFPDKPLSIWDCCCGAGRHTILISQMGHKAYASDISENGINYTQKWLESNELMATLKVADMTNNPFPDTDFHGAISWDALHHNTIDNINKAVDIVYENLCAGGMFMVSLLSTKAGRPDLRGKEIEKNTFVREDGPEKGVPHHYFDEQGIRDLFRKWKIISLVDIVVTYTEVNIDHSINPFPYTKWNVIVQK
ncbi:class I SAM-dependent methyltransferase [Clostridium sp. D2Q-11]|uniref:Class I SAM-dependent methyltransferase n=1 Tax=Anaeromonas frigoriresistens TaxID=2683708 RepID=A0A942UX72_9FIRM|nr:class I SAM-dependent methyltransferase [Anaeromonas frigoriresistens]MBS4538459.1 class I SAM-dependent methyltransferase [Anaeromonas frigoriresistens]